MHICRTKTSFSAEFEVQLDVCLKCFAALFPAKQWATFVYIINVCSFFWGGGRKSAFTDCESCDVELLRYYFIVSSLCFCCGNNQ